MNVLNSCGALLAIETNDEDMLKTVMSKTNITFDARIDDVHLKEWTLLEFALMLGHRQCAEVLFRSGATIDVESCPLERRLQQIKVNTELITEEIRFLKTTNAQNEDKKVDHLRKRLLQMKKMETVLKNTIVPGQLTGVEAVISASDQLTVSWEDIRQQNMDLVVNYKVEWSLCDNFNSIEGSLIMHTAMKNCATISELKRGVRYSVRVSAASIRGFGYPTLAKPRSLLLTNISKLLLDFENYRSSPVWQRLFPKSSKMVDKKKSGSIKNLIIDGFRSLKVMQRGIYLVSIIYSEMKVCTVEDYLPVILIDGTEFCIKEDEMYWAIKLSLAWDEMQTLQEANNSCSSNSHFRNKFIDAAMEMHATLGVKDIGRVHYQPVIDEVNSISFIVTVRVISGSQVIQGLTTKWLPLNKIVRKRGACQAMDVLWAEILKIINFFECSHMRLRRGLYICYMKLYSSISSISVIVPRHMPSILPYAFIR